MQATQRMAANLQSGSHEERGPHAKAQSWAHLRNHRFTCPHVEVTFVDMRGSTSRRGTLAACPSYRFDEHTTKIRNEGAGRSIPALHQSVGRMETAKAWSAWSKLAQETTPIGSSPTRNSARKVWP